MTGLPAIVIGGEAVPFDTFVASCVDAARGADHTARVWQQRAWASARADEPLLPEADAAGALGVVELTLTFHLRLRHVPRLERWLTALSTWWRRFARLPSVPRRPAWKVCSPADPDAVTCAVVVRRDAAGWQHRAVLPS